MKLTAVVGREMRSQPEPTAGSSRLPIEAETGPGERGAPNPPGVPGRSLRTVKEQGSRTTGTGSQCFRMPVAWRPARIFVRLVLQAAVRSDTDRRRPFWQAPMQPHCARLVVAGRRRDRDDPCALRARETVKRRSGRPSHGPPSPRRGTASPPPTHPEYTAAPSVECQEYKHTGKRASRTFFKNLAPSSRKPRSGYPGSPSAQASRAPDRAAWSSEALQRS